MQIGRHLGGWVVLCVMCGVVWEFIDDAADNNKLYVFDCVVTTNIQYNMHKTSTKRIEIITNLRNQKHWNVRIKATNKCMYNNRNAIENGTNSGISAQSNAFGNALLVHFAPDPPELAGLSDQWPTL